MAAIESMVFVTRMLSATMSQLTSYKRQQTALAPKVLLETESTRRGVL